MWKCLWHGWGTRMRASGLRRWTAARKLGAPRSYAIIAITNQCGKFDTNPFNCLMHFFVGVPQETILERQRDSYSHFFVAS